MFNQKILQATSKIIQVTTLSLIEQISHLLTVTVIVSVNVITHLMQWPDGVKVVHVQVSETGYTCTRHEILLRKHKILIRNCCLNLSLFSDLPLKSSFQRRCYWQYQLGNQMKGAIVTFDPESRKTWISGNTISIY